MEKRILRGHPIEIISELHPSSDISVHTNDAAIIIKANPDNNGWHDTCIGLIKVSPIIVGRNGHRHIDVYYENKILQPKVGRRGQNKNIRWITVNEDGVGRQNIRNGGELIIDTSRPVAFILRPEDV